MTNSVYRSIDDFRIAHRAKGHTVIGMSAVPAIPTPSTEPMLRGCPTCGHNAHESWGCSGNATCNCETMWEVTDVDLQLAHDRWADEQEGIGRVPAWAKCLTCDLVCDEGAK